MTQAMAWKLDPQWQVPVLREEPCNSLAPQEMKSMGGCEMVRTCTRNCTADSKKVNYATQLPVDFHRMELLKKLDECEVLLVKGEAGTGKTARVPSFILDDCLDKDVPCRFLCALPRRMLTI